MKLFDDLQLNSLNSSLLREENLEYFIPKNTNRYLHIIGVINLAKEIENTISFNGDLIAASLYHDIGYSQKLKVTGFHPVDSALKAHEDRVDNEIIKAILSHTAAKGEALLINKSLLKYYKHIDEDTLLAKFLTYCDTHVNSKGIKVSLEKRLNDIYSRYNSNHYVYRNIKNHEAYFKEIERDVEKRLEGKI